MLFLVRQHYSPNPCGEFEGFSEVARILLASDWPGLTRGSIYACGGPTQIVYPLAPVVVQESDRKCPSSICCCLELAFCTQ
jgi:hypothetical protein